MASQFMDHDGSFRQLTCSMWAGRQDDRACSSAALSAIPPLSGAWLGSDCDREVDGWFAHRLVFDYLAQRAIDWSD